MNNGGLLKTNQQGHLKNYRNLWYYPNYIRNILSLSNVKKKNGIIFDSNNRYRLIVINTRSG